MAERSDTQHYWQLLLLTNLQKLSQITLTAPVEDAFRLLDMVPEHIAGYDCHATLLHLTNLASPFFLRDARIVHLAHHGTDTPSVNHQAILVPCHFGQSPWFLNLSPRFPQNENQAYESQ